MFPGLPADFFPQNEEGLMEFSLQKRLCTAPNVFGAPAKYMGTNWKILLASSNVLGFDSYRK